MKPILWGFLANNGIDFQKPFLCIYSGLLHWRVLKPIVVNMHAVERETNSLTWLFDGWYVCFEFGRKGLSRWCSLLRWIDTETDIVKYNNFWAQGGYFLSKSPFCILVYINIWETNDFRQQARVGKITRPVVMFYKVKNQLKPVMKFNTLKSFAAIQLSEITWSSPKLAKCFWRRTRGPPDSYGNTAWDRK